MDVVGDVLELTTADGPMAVLRKAPAAPGAWPTIVMFHDGPGVRTATHEFSARLASEGFVVVVPDLYHRHGRLIGYDPAERAADPSIGKRMWELLSSLTDEGIQADLDTTLAALGLDPGTKVATIGFCLGARAVFRTLVRLPDVVAAGAMWHPSFLADDEPDSPHRTAGDLRQPLYIGIGDADEVQPIAAHQRFFDAVAPLPHVEVEVFAGADHGYTWPDHPTYHREAAETSFTKTLALFRAALPA